MYEVHTQRDHQLLLHLHVEMVNENFVITKTTFEKEAIVPHFEKTTPHKHPHPMPYEA
jgi:hypothetical protein